MCTRYSTVWNDGHWLEQPIPTTECCRHLLFWRLRTFDDCPKRLRGCKDGSPLRGPGESHGNLRSEQTDSLADSSLSVRPQGIQKDERKHQTSVIRPGGRRGRKYTRVATRFAECVGFRSGRCVRGLANRGQKCNSFLMWRR